MPSSVLRSKKLVALPVLPTRPVRPILDEEKDSVAFVKEQDQVIPVDILLHLLGHGEVDHVCDPLDVETSGSHGSGHQDWLPA